MSTHKKRNHYIPRILLNRFASVADGKRSHFRIWVYSKDQPLREVSTRDVGLEKFFYGKADSSLEEKFSALEGRLAQTLKAIDKTNDVERHAAFLSEYAWIQVLRTRSFRLRFSDAITQIMTSAADTAYSENATDFFLRYAREVVGEELQKIPQSKRDEVAQRFGMPVELLAEVHTERFIRSGEMAAFMASALKGLSQSPIFAEGIARGHNRALSTIDSQDRKVPERLRELKWSVNQVAAGSLVLGDCCLLGWAGDNAFGPVSDAVTWSRLIFPISPKTYLSATDIGEEGPLESGAINVASVGGSIKQYFASTPDKDSLLHLIGGLASMLKSGEAEEIGVDAWSR